MEEKKPVDPKLYGLPYTFLHKMFEIDFLECYAAPIVLTKNLLWVCSALWSGLKSSRGSALEEVSIRLERKAELRE